MRSIIAAALCAALASTSAIASPLQDQVLGVTAQLNGNCSTTLIHSDRDKKSGDVTTLFLTAKHCIGDAKADMVIDIPVYQNSRVVKKDRYIGTVKSQHFSSDLALLELKDKQTFFETTAKIAPEDGIPAMGDPVVTAGYPLGLQLTITAGLFGSLETIKFPTTYTEYFRATPDVVGGNSGGSMYRKNGEDYELIGVTAAGHRAYSFVTFYTPLEQIHTFLRASAPAVVGHDPKAKKKGGL